MKRVCPPVCNCDPSARPMEPDVTKQEEMTEILTEDELVDISTSSPSNYFLVFERNKNIIYFIRDFTLPGANNRYVSVPRPMADPTYKIAGVATEYEDLNFNFLVDENFHCYFNMLRWMRENERMDNIRDTISRASLFILNNAKKPIIEVKFTDIFPISLGSLTFENQTDEILTANCSMANHHYMVRYLDYESDLKFGVKYEWELGINGPPRPLFRKYEHIVGPK